MNIIYCCCKLIMNEHFQNKILTYLAQLLLSGSPYGLLAAEEIRWVFDDI